MVFSTLWARLTSLWSTGSATETGESDTDQTDDESSDRTLSYAEQFEYGVDERDLPDEDKILRLLVEEGGRVNVATVLEKTDWSEDHLATVIDHMESDNQISAITVGRERVICRRGFEPKGYRSHLSE